MRVELPVFQILIAARRGYCEAPDLLLSEFGVLVNLEDGNLDEVVELADALEDVVSRLEVEVNDYMGDGTKIKEILALLECKGKCVKRMTPDIIAHF